MGTSLIEEWTQKPSLFLLGEMPLPIYPLKYDSYANTLQLFFPFLLVMSFLLPVVQGTKAIVSEKEKKLKVWKLCIT